MAFTAFRVRLVSLYTRPAPPLRRISTRRVPSCGDAIPPRVLRETHLPGAPVWRASQRLTILPERLSPSVAAIQSRLHSGPGIPALLLRDLTSEGEATLDAFYLCLMAADKHLKQMPRKMRRAEIDNTPIVVVLLEYIWGRPDLWIPLVLRDHETKFVICYLAIAERLEDYIVQWLEIDDSPSYAEHLSADGVHTWRGPLLRGLVAAHLFLDSDRSADAALRCFFHALENKLKAKSAFSRSAEHHPHPYPSPLVYMSTWPATIKLSAALGSGWYPNTYVSLYDRFVEFKRTVAIEKYAVAKLRLWHPRSPNADEALQFILDIYTNRPIAEVARSLPPTTNGRDLCLISSAAQSLFSRRLDERQTPAVSKRPRKKYFRT